MQSMLPDLASLVTSLMPPKGLLKKSKAPKPTLSDPVASPAATPTANPTGSRPKLVVRITKVTVGIANVVMGYQTAVEVPAQDRPEGGPLMLLCTECITLQELAGEALLSTCRGSVQVNNLTILHQETHSSRGAVDPPSQQASGKHHEVEILHATHFSLQAGASPQGHRAGSLGSSADQGSNSENLPNSGSSSEQGLAGLPSMAATVALTGWHTVFHADAAIALCKAAADFTSIARQTASRLQLPDPYSADISPSPGQMPMTQPSEAAVASAVAPAQDTAASLVERLSKLQRLPAVTLTVEVSRWKTDVVVADHIVWGVTVPEIQCKLDSRILVAVQQQHLQAQLSHQQEGAEPYSDPRGAAPWHSPHGLPGRSSHELVLVAEHPRLIVRQIRVSLNRKPLLQCAEIETSLDLWPSLDSQRSARQLQVTPSGSPRRQASLGEPHA